MTDTSITAAFGSVTAMFGALTITTAATGVAHVSFPALQTTASIDVMIHPTLVSFSAPVLASVSSTASGYSVRFRSCDELTTIDMPLFHMSSQATAEVNLQGNPKLATLTMGTASSGNPFTARRVSVLVCVALQSLGGSFHGATLESLHLDRVNALTDAAMTVVSIDHLIIDDASSLTSLAGFVAPDESIGTLQLLDNNLLADVSALDNALKATSADRTIIITNNPALSSLSDALAKVVSVGYIRVIQNPSLVELSMPLLESTTSSSSSRTITVENNNAQLTTINMPMLHNVQAGADIIIKDMPNLKTLVMGTIASGNPFTAHKMQLSNLPSLESFDGSFHMATMGSHFYFLNCGMRRVNVNLVASTYVFFSQSPNLESIIINGIPGTTQVYISDNPVLGRLELGFASDAIGTMTILDNPQLLYAEFPGITTGGTVANLLIELNPQLCCSDLTGSINGFSPSNADDCDNVNACTCPDNTAGASCTSTCIVTIDSGDRAGDPNNCGPVWVLTAEDVTVNEADGTGTIGLSLTFEPIDDVTVNFSPPTGTALVGQAAPLTFTPANYGTLQDIVFAIGDDSVDGPNEVGVFAGTASIADSLLDGISTPDLSVEVVDNDFCGDGIVGDGEECDDGNADETDACTSLCVRSSCGGTFTSASAAMSTLSSCTELFWPLIIDFDDVNDAALSLPLVTEAAAITFGGHGLLSTADMFDNLVTVHGRLIVSPSSALQVLTLPSLERIDVGSDGFSDLYVRNSPSIREIDLPMLNYVRAAGPNIHYAIAIMTNNNLERIWIPRLETSSGRCWVRTNPLLADMTIGAKGYVTSTSVSVSVSLHLNPLITVVDSDFFLYNANLPQDLLITSMSGLKTVRVEGWTIGRDLEVHDNPELTTITGFDGIVSGPGRTFTVSNNPKLNVDIGQWITGPTGATVSVKDNGLTHLSLDNFVSVSSIAIEEPLLQVASFASLTAVTGDGTGVSISVANSPVLSKLSMPLLATVADDVVLQNLPMLSTLRIGTFPDAGTFTVPDVLLDGIGASELGGSFHSVIVSGAFVVQNTSLLNFELDNADIASLEIADNPALARIHVVTTTASGNPLTLDSNPALRKISFPFTTSGIATFTVSDHPEVCCSDFSSLLTGYSPTATSCANTASCACGADQTGADCESCGCPSGRCRDNGLLSGTKFVCKPAVEAMLAGPTVNEGSQLTMSISLAFGQPTSDTTVSVSVADAVADNVAVSNGNLVFSSTGSWLPRTVTFSAWENDERRLAKVTDVDVLIDVSSDDAAIIAPDPVSFKIIDNDRVAKPSSAPFSSARSSLCLSESSNRIGRAFAHESVAVTGTGFTVLAAISPSSMVDQRLLVVETEAPTGPDAVFALILENGLVRITAGKRGDVAPLPSAFARETVVARRWNIIGIRFLQTGDDLTVFPIVNGVVGVSAATTGLVMSLAGDGSEDITNVASITVGGQLRVPSVLNAGDDAELRYLAGFDGLLHSLAVWPRDTPPSDYGRLVLDAFRSPASCPTGASDCSILFTFENVPDVDSDGATRTVSDVRSLGQTATAIGTPLVTEGLARFDLLGFFDRIRFDASVGKTPWQQPILEPEMSLDFPDTCPVLLPCDSSNGQTAQPFTATAVLQRDEEDAVALSIDTVSGEAVLWSVDGTALEQQRVESAGLTWGSADVVATLTGMPSTVDGERYHALTVHGDDVFAYFTDGTDGFVIFSADHGATWTAPETVPTGAMKNAVLATSADGSLAVAGSPLASSDMRIRTRNPVGVWRSDIVDIAGGTGAHMVAGGPENVFLFCTMMPDAGDARDVDCFEASEGNSLSAAIRLPGNSVLGDVIFSSKEQAWHVLGSTYDGEFSQPTLFRIPLSSATSHVIGPVAAETVAETAPTTTRAAGRLLVDGQGRYVVLFSGSRGNDKIRVFVSSTRGRVWSDIGSALESGFASSPVASLAAVVAHDRLLVAAAQFSSTTTIATEQVCTARLAPVAADTLLVPRSVVWQFDANCADCMTVENGRVTALQPEVGPAMTIGYGIGGVITKNAINGFNALTVNGEGYYTTPGRVFREGHNSVTFVAVLRVIHDETKNSVVFASEPASTAASMRFSWMLSQKAGKYLGLIREANDIYSAGDKSAPSAAWVVASLRVSPGVSINMRFTNGHGLFFEENKSGGTTSPPHDQLAFLGVPSKIDAESTIGDVAAAFAFERTLEDDELANLERALVTKYGLHAIPVPLPPATLTFDTAGERISETSGGMVGVTFPGSARFGRAVNLIADPDINQDGIADIVTIFWASGDSSFFFLELALDGSVAEVHEYTATDIGATDTRGVGQDAASLGDFDGLSETVTIVLGHVDDDKAYIVKVKPDFSFHLTDDVGNPPFVKVIDPSGSTTANFQPENDYTYEVNTFGSAVVNIGDMDGDGLTDVAISDPYAQCIAPENPAGRLNQCGMLFLIFLDANLDVKSYLPITSKTETLAFAATGFDFVLEAESTFSRGLASLGDLDGNGTPDLAIAADSAGDVYVVLMEKHPADQRPVVKATIAYDEDFFESTLGLAASFKFGLSIDAGDFDNDYHRDILIGRWSTNDVLIMMLNEDGTYKDMRLISGNVSPAFTTLRRFGYSVTAGDINGDRLMDMVVADETNTDGGSNNGALYVMFQDEE